jgi:hypothetical protein
MAYFVVQTKKKSGTSVRILFDFWVDKKRRFKTLTKDEWRELGFKEGAPVEILKAQAAKLNEEQHRLRWDRKRAAVQDRLKQEDRENVLFLPEALEQKFLKNEIDERPKHLQKKYRILWRRARRIIKAVGLDYLDWKRKARVIYQHLAEQHLSPDYCKKMLAMLNLWGEFVAHETGKVYAPIPTPKGHDKEQITDAYFDHLENSKESVPLTPEDLNTLKPELPEPQWNWLYVSVWLGLRPKEIDSLSKRDLAWRVEEHEGTKVFVVYQSKLTAVPREQRWKYIPVLFPEQEIALQSVKRGSLSRPLPKTLKRYLKKRVHLYGGRKGFQDLMMARGRTFVEVQAWLGHSSIERTWRSYRNKTKVFIEKK